MKSLEFLLVTTSKALVTRSDALVPIRLLSSLFRRDSFTAFTREVHRAQKGLRAWPLYSWLQDEAQHGKAWQITAL